MKVGNYEEDENRSNDLAGLVEELSERYVKLHKINDNHLTE